ncbi:hypothetical protein [Streptomyces albidoflavus]|uniref:hypothetical protein n=1 Tax=Streptomyces albidoflavus TaxID=1886 RepID=UPI001A92BFF2|nr:hypothetical protein [Streptomyces albidoflavus]
MLDEPTSGLHCADTDRLVAYLQTLVEAGNTVVMIELNMRAVSSGTPRMSPKEASERRRNTSPLHSKNPQRGTLCMTDPA